MNWGQVEDNWKQFTMVGPAEPAQCGQEVPRAQERVITMRNVLAAMLGTLIILTGCNQGTPGGPGASGPDSDKAVVGQTDETFSLDVPMLSTKVNQGETAAVSIGIKRGRNMDGDVTLKFDGLPEGVTIEPASPAIKRQDTEAQLTLRAAENASLGDFTVKVMGHPTKGPDALKDLKITVAKHPTSEAVDAAAETAKAEREEYALEARKQLDELDEKCEDLKARAAQAEGDAKKDLEIKVAQAKEKRDVAAERLDELQWASADRWEQVKEGVANAFHDLKAIFE